ncbi:hypothetical protein [Cohnella boryungensis]|uniref:DUF1617 family protein n=1 Tax=Cohnella boryungensis TaxID=768479 RepID=A0ABV8S925_9BACL
MKIKNGQIDFYTRWLLNQLKLAGKKNRMRMKFLEILAARGEELRKYHLQLLKEHCSLDEQGNPVIVQAEGEQRRYEVMDELAFEQDFRELLEEAFTIEENEENKEMLLVLKESIEECPETWAGEAAIEYEQICKLFDTIYEE